MKIRSNYRKSFSLSLLIVAALFICLSGNSQYVSAQQKCPPLDPTEVSIPVTRCVVLFLLNRQTIPGTDTVLTPKQKSDAVIMLIKRWKGISFVLTPLVEAEFMEAGATPELMKVIKREWDKVSSQPLYFLRLADGLRAQRSYEEAIENYNKALELDPGNVEIYHNRAVAFSDLGKKYKDEANQFKKESREEDAVKSFEESNRYYDRAIEDFTTAIRMDPSGANRYYSRGVVYSYKPTNNNIEQTKANNRKAIEDFERAIYYNPDYIEAYRQRAEAHRFLGERENAVNDYQKCIERGGCREERIRSYVSASRPE
jgi:tetratricopeptide (TPR) repeat protein